MKKQPQEKKSPQEIVRVLRVIEYEGPRSWVEETVRKSIHGEKQVSLGCFIRAASVNVFPKLIAIRIQAASRRRQEEASIITRAMRG